MLVLRGQFVDESDEEFGEDRALRSVGRRQSGALGLRALEQVAIVGESARGKGSGVQRVGRVGVSGLAHADRQRACPGGEFALLMTWATNPMHEEQTRHHPSPPPEARLIGISEVSNAPVPVERHPSVFAASRALWDGVSPTCPTGPREGAGVACTALLHQSATRTRPTPSASPPTVCARRALRLVHPQSHRLGTAGVREDGPGHGAGLRGWRQGPAGTALCT